MGDCSIVGKRVPSKDAVPKVTGQAKYGDDLFFPQMLYGAILRSPYPHARIINIDVSRVERLVGVKAAITGKDTAEIAAKATAAGYRQRHQILALDKVRFVGEPVAAVAATDEEIAQEALELIRVEYEELPHVLDPEEAMKPGAPVIHDHAPHNVVADKTFEYGDVEEGFQASHLVREDKFITPRVTHAFMESHVVAASYDASGKLTMWCSKMTIRGYVAAIASTLGLTEGEVRAISSYVGGSFGGKGAFVMNHDVIAALLSIRTGRPVKVTLSREEIFYNLCKAPTIIHLKTGVKKDGTLMATEARAIIDSGAHAGVGATSTFFMGKYIAQPYRIPNFRYKGYRVYTNNPVGGPQRAVSNPQARFAVESQFDMLAEDLGIDPVELRLKNAMGPGEVTPLGVEFISCGLRDCIQKAAQTIGWQEPRPRPGLKGVGIGTASAHGGWSLPFPGFKVPYRLAWPIHARLHESGKVTLYAVTKETGQGAPTVLCQLAAEELGIPLEDVAICSGDSATSPADRISSTGSDAYAGARAATAAAHDLKRQIFEVVADKLECSPQDLEAKDSRIYVKGSQDKGISFSEAALAVFATKGAILGRGSWTPTKDREAAMKSDKANTSDTYTFSAYTAEVEVDPDTGKVKLGKMAGAYDCGFAINPMFVEGQIEGGISMGVGWAMSEEIFKDKEGQILNPTFLDYRIATALDMPEIEPILVEPMDPAEGPYGAKEGGEGTAIATAPTIANAIYDAVGVRITSLPITPEKVLKALQGESSSG